MIDVNFVLACEGVSDKPLVSVLRKLLIAAGASSAAGEALAMTGTVESKIRRIVRDYPGVNLLFVHRDSDEREHEPRYREIEEAVTRASWDGAYVSVVPVRSTEAWLLTSEAPIREVAGKRGSREPLDLPALSAIERTADPKGVLRRAYFAAVGETGRRKKTAAHVFGDRREALIDRLDVRGRVCELPSFARLVEEVDAAVSLLSRSIAEDA